MCWPRIRAARSSCSYRRSPCASSAPASRYHHPGPRPPQCTGRSQRSPWPKPRQALLGQRPGRHCCLRTSSSSVSARLSVSHFSAGTAADWAGRCWRCQPSHNITNEKVRIKTSIRRCESICGESFRSVNQRRHEPSRRQEYVIKGGNGSNSWDRINTTWIPRMAAPDPTGT